LADTLPVAEDGRVVPGGGETAALARDEGAGADGGDDVEVRDDLSATANSGG